MTSILEIKDLNANIDDKKILKGINLDIKPGEVHAIMGPNGAGKSTLANVLTGRDHYDVTNGDVKFKEQNVLDLSPDERTMWRLSDPAGVAHRPDRQHGRRRPDRGGNGARKLVLIPLPALSLGGHRSRDKPLSPFTPASRRGQLGLR